MAFMIVPLHDFGAVEDGSLSFSKTYRCGKIFAPDAVSWIHTGVNPLHIGHFVRKVVSGYRLMEDGDWLFCPKVVFRLQLWHFVTSSRGKNLLFARSKNLDRATRFAFNEGVELANL